MSAASRGGAIVLVSRRPHQSHDRSADAGQTADQLYSWRCRSEVVSAGCGPVFANPTETSSSNFSIPNNAVAGVRCRPPLSLRGVLPRWYSACAAASEGRAGRTRTGRAERRAILNTAHNQNRRPDRARPDRAGRRDTDAAGAGVGRHPRRHLVRLRTASETIAYLKQPRHEPWSTADRTRSN